MPVVPYQQTKAPADILAEMLGVSNLTPGSEAANAIDVSTDSAMPIDPRTGRNAEGYRAPLANPYQDEIDKANQEEAVRNELAKEAAQENIKTQGQIAVGKAQSENVIAQQAAQAKNKQDALESLLQGSPNGQYQKTINPSGDVTLKENEPPAQIKSMAQFGKQSMAQIDDVRAYLADPEVQQYIGPIMSKLTGLDTGTPSLANIEFTKLAANPATQAKLYGFTQSLQGAVAEIARLYNQRGATKELVELFRPLMSGRIPPAMLSGALDTAYRQAQRVAAGDPSLGIQQPDPLASTLGVR